jgi:hypothetical protein
METKLIAIILLVSVPASAADDGETKRSTGPLERRIIFPDLLGIQIGTAGPGSLGAYTSVGGLVSYSSQDVGPPLGPAHAESFGIHPSLDVRAGRFTIGGALLFSHSYVRSTFDGFESQTRSLAFELVPRVGMLFPIARHVTLWPRVGVGFLIAKNDTNGGVLGGIPALPSSGFIASGDLLVALDLGSHFFLAGGPTVRFLQTSAPQQSSADLRAGATAALGVAF